MSLGEARAGDVCSLNDHLLALYRNARSLLMTDYVSTTVFSLKVMGDKKGGKTSKILIDPSNMSRLEEIRELVQVPMKFIHVVRNPFDNISTMTLRKASKRNAARQEGFKVSCFLFSFPY